MKKIKLLALLLGVCALFSACASGSSGENTSLNSNTMQSSVPTKEDDDTARFAFNNPNDVGACYQYMDYPFQNSRDYLQILVGDRVGEELCSYSVDKKLTITLSDSLISFTNISFRVYSTAFDNHNVGDLVKVRMKLKLNPDTAWDLFLGVRGEDGNERHIMNAQLPKTGNFEMVEWVTQIENSNAFYFNHSTRPNAKNVQFAFFRIAVGEVFEIDSIDFEFIN